MGNEIINNNNIVWAHFMSKEMENLKEGSQENPQEEVEIKMGTTDWQRLNTKGRNNVEGVP